MRLKHQHLSFQNSFIAQWQVYSHLVTIEVGIERSTCQWMQLNSFTFNHLRLECLDTQTVQSRSTVQQYRMTLHHMFKDVPNNRFLTVHNLFRRLHSFYNTTLNQFTNDKRFVQFCSHQFRNTALTHLQFWTNDDNRTCRIVNTLTQQVLTETSLFTFQTIRKRFQRTVCICFYST